MHLHVHAIQVRECGALECARCVRACVRAVGASVGRSVLSTAASATDANDDNRRQRATCDKCKLKAFLCTASEPERQPHTHTQHKRPHKTACVLREICCESARHAHQHALQAATALLTARTTWLPLELHLEISRLYFKIMLVLYRDFRKNARFNIENIEYAVW